MAFLALFLMVAVPVILGAVIWTGWLMWSIVFPEEPQPVEKFEGGTPIGLAGILSQQRRSPSQPVMPWHQRVGATGEDGEDALAEDLWRRRN